MKIKEILASLTGESVTLLLNGKIYLCGELYCSKYGSEFPYVHSKFVKLEFAYDCVTQITYTNSDIIIEIELSVEPKLSKEEPAVLTPVE